MSSHLLKIIEYFIPVIILIWIMLLPLLVLLLITCYTAFPFEQVVKD